VKLIISQKRKHPVDKVRLGQLFINQMTVVDDRSSDLNFLLQPLQKNIKYKKLKNIIHFSALKRML
jgi:competence protein ComGF